MLKNYGIVAQVESVGCGLKIHMLTVRATSRLCGHGMCAYFALLQHNKCY